MRANRMNFCRVCYKPNRLTNGFATNPTKIMSGLQQTGQTICRFCYKLDVKSVGIVSNLMGILRVFLRNHYFYLQKFVFHALFSCQKNMVDISIRFIIIHVISYLIISFKFKIKYTYPPKLSFGFKQIRRIICQIRNKLGHSISCQRKFD